VNRKRLLVGLVALGGALGIYYLAHSSRSKGEHAAAGKIAPDFSLPDLSGRQIQLSAYRGKVVLLDFWATWCEPCRQEIPHFVDLQNKYGSQGFQTIGVSMDDGPEPVRDFYQQFKMNYPVVMGNAKIGEFYGGVLGLPIAFLIGRDGRIHFKHIGATGNAVFEKEVVSLLQEPDDSSHGGS
jgi:peroxiredoxin